jgi:hypothetical protein
MASLRQPREAASSLGGDVLGNEVVDVRRLDGVLKSMLGEAAEPRIFLKLDTQGWDTEAIQGASGCLPWIHAIQTEIAVDPLYQGMPSWIEAMTQLADLGFVPTAMFPVTFYGSFRAIEFDLVAVRRES